ncbi:tail protein [Salmonella enterica]|uniref:Tail protein n=1 Tax=Salmonella enterica TaxID=28901 RepID=A0A379R1N6_SALER|nr:tail protein [Salmonella enterica]
MVQFPALKAAIRDGWYQVRIAKRDTGEAELSQRMNERLPEGAVVHIVPRQSGAKSGGVFQIIAGAALVAIGAVVTYFGGGAVGVPLMQAGGAMILGGWCSC